MHGTHPHLRSSRGPLLAPDDDARASAELLSDRMRRLALLAQAFSACPRREDAALALAAALDVIPARMLRLVEVGPAGQHVVAAWPEASRELPPAARAA